MGRSAKGSGQSRPSPIAALGHDNVSAEDPDQAHQIVAIPMAADKRFGAPQVSAQGQVPIEPRVVYLDLGLKPRRTAGAEHVTSAAVDDLNPPVPDLFQPVKDGPPQEAVPETPSAGA
jgi:hypothetical protein